jgi:hypothetical protein
MDGDRRLLHDIRRPDLGPYVWRRLAIGQISQVAARHLANPADRVGHTPVSPVNQVTNVGTRIQWSCQVAAA